MWTYNNFLVDEVTALIAVEGEFIRKDSHHNNGGDPDQYIAGKEERRMPVSSAPSQFHTVEVERMSGRWEWFENSRSRTAGRLGNLSMRLNQGKQEEIAEEAAILICGRPYVNWESSM
jgi:hypothetical protein